MTSIVDKLNEFRGTRLAQGISATIFLGLGLYNLFFESGGFALVIGILFPSTDCSESTGYLSERASHNPFRLESPSIGLDYHGRCKIICHGMYVRLL